MARCSHMRQCLSLCNSIVILKYVYNTYVK